MSIPHNRILVTDTALCMLRTWMLVRARQEARECDQAWDEDRSDHLRARDEESENEGRSGGPSHSEL